MTGCECPHETNEHAPIGDFGISMCLVADCDCMGTQEQVAAAKVARVIRMAPTATRVYELVREVLGNPMHVTLEEKARNVAAVIVGEFEMVRR